MLLLEGKVKEKDASGIVSVFKHKLKIYV